MLFTERKANNIDRVHQSYIFGSVESSIMPVYYILEPTNRCNYACGICPNRLYTEDEKGFMPIELFERIINQIKDYAEVIQLYWVGEPLLHPEISKMIALCKRHTSAKIMISTNGSLLSEDVILNLISNRLDKLIVSMDAAESEEIYRMIRINGDLLTLNGNVMALLNHASELDITLQFILTNTNETEKEKFIKKWDKRGVKISIQCLYTWANQLSELRDESFYLSPMVGTTQTACSDLWYKMPIHWNGKVSRCFFDWSFNNTIGDANTQSIAEIWNSDKLRQLRYQHYNKIFDCLCGQCDAWAVESEYETLFD